MKKIILISSLTLVIFATFMSCENKPVYNEQQTNFSSFLSVKQGQKSYVKNDIEKIEFNRSFEKDLASYLDTIPIFVNWVGIISDIKVKEDGGYVLAEYDIAYKYGNSLEVTFHNSHVNRSVNMKNDYFFNKLKNIKNNSTVYFDGYIKRLENKKVEYYLPSLYDDVVSRPHYHFNAVAIGTIPGEDSLSKNLQHAIRIDYKTLRPYSLMHKTFINEKEFDEELNDLGFDSIQNLLSPTEKTYSKRLRERLHADWLNAQ